MHNVHYTCATFNSNLMKRSGSRSNGTLFLRIHPSRSMKVTSEELTVTSRSQRKRKNMFSGGLNLLCAKSRLVAHQKSGTLKSLGPSKVWDPHSDPAERLRSPSFTPDIVNGPHQTPQPTREPYYSTVQGPKYSRPERTAVKSEDFGQVHSADLSIQPVTAVKINPYAEGGGGG